MERKKICLSCLSCLATYFLHLLKHRWKHILLMKLRKNVSQILFLPSILNYYFYFKLFFSNLWRILRWNSRFLYRAVFKLSPSFNFLKKLSTNLCSFFLILLSTSTLWDDFSAVNATFANTVRVNSVHEEWKIKSMFVIDTHLCWSSCYDWGTRPNGRSSCPESYL